MVIVFVLYPKDFIPIYLGYETICSLHWYNVINFEAKTSHSFVFELYSKNLKPIDPILSYLLTHNSPYF